MSTENPCMHTASDAAHRLTFEEAEKRRNEPVTITRDELELLLDVALDWLALDDEFDGPDAMPFIADVLANLVARFHPYGTKDLSWADAKQELLEQAVVEWRERGGAPADPTPASFREWFRESHPEEDERIPWWGLNAVLVSRFPDFQKLDESEAQDGGRLMAASSSETVMGNVADRLAIDDDGLAIIRSRAEWAQLFRPSEALSELPDHAGLDHIWTEFTFEEGERSAIKNGLWREPEAVCHYVSEVAVPEDVAVWVLEPPPQTRWKHGSSA